VESLIVGLTGSFGSGCSEVADFLASQNGYRVYRLSQILEKETERRHIPLPPAGADKRAVLQREGLHLRALRGGGILVQMALLQWSKSGRAGICVLDGIKNLQEIDELRKEKNAYVIAIGASVETRWRRLESQYRGDRDLFDKLDDIDKNEGIPNGQMVEACVHAADVMVDNEDNWSNEQLRQQLYDRILGFVDLFREPGRRDPPHPDILMHDAYEASLNSQCLSRKVGAVLVHQEGPSGTARILGMGYNHAPLGSTECKDKWGQCYREKKRQELLQKLPYCPSCGSPLKDGYCIHQPCDYWLGRGDILERSCPGRALDVCPAVHAEQDAIIKAMRGSGQFPANCSLYCTTFPCALCAKLIIGADIKEVVYVHAYPMQESRELLEAAGIRLLQFQGVKGEAFSRLFPAWSA
jgi:deoxycytidylate deaminase/dephospho-CoA kinase